MKNINYFIEIADIHVKRITSAQEKINDLVPFTLDTVKNLDEMHLAWIDLLINRFGKLQDLIGAKLIDYFLEVYQESSDNCTMLDKLNKLERLQIIQTDLWVKMREARNHVAHEYPHEPALTAHYLNSICELIPELTKLYSKIKSKIEAAHK